VIVVGGENDELVGEDRVRSQKDATHIGSFGIPDLDRKIEGGRNSERYRSEFAGSRRFNHGIEVVPRELDEPARRLLGHPRLQLNPRLFARGKLELLAAPPCQHHLPRVTRGEVGVDNDRSDGAFRRGDFVLILPTSVIQPSFAGKELRVPIGIVVEH